MSEQERKTLRDYLLQGGIKGKWFEDKVYDSNNPFYRVDDTKVVRGDTDMEVLDRTVYPSGLAVRNAMIFHYDDFEALPADVAQFQQTLTD